MRYLLAALAVCPAVAFAASASSPWQPDAAFVQYGHQEDTRSVTLGLNWDWSWSRPLGGGLLGGYHELALGRWRADVPEGHENFTQLGYTPVLRWWGAGEPRGWFLEGGIGLNVVTPRFRTLSKHVGSNFTFGDHLGVGWRSSGGTELSLRFQHFSNAGLAEPNPAVDFVQLRLSLPLQTP
ncbi:acyloxyacyl hydrolase [Azohydromonas caseinilytica]|uniref:Lipid A deacylase n=1 Tax=Azohydromonas caseinilytica TaxID=2728836 RepID=A0A848F8I7_9BURK|nr:acyloxyacyl hydrolase [Azohydromonas caseinilytica]NML15874.1 acyloxyacyl hydrolase [Azohydromonas caseinilytica]